MSDSANAGDRYMERIVGQVFWYGQLFPSHADSVDGLLDRCMALRTILVDVPEDKPLPMVPTYVSDLWDEMIRLAPRAVHPSHPPADIRSKKQCLEAVNTVIAWCNGAASTEVNSDANKYSWERGQAGAESAPLANLRPTAQSGKSDNRYETLSKIDRAHCNAYLAFLYAEAIAERRLEDKEAYDWLRENGIEDPELGDYVLPAFDTWTRYLRAARKATGEQKYTSRIERERSR
ncbi:MAG: hypothetical protein H6822_06230 [Planctomycetaceae bacterium]|nr:hypothetical protein [Planctomycetales bacterium]MCB9921758.1 hypothetical protein [Planctomycetaceae bacterium]